MASRSVVDGGLSRLSHLQHVLYAVGRQEQDQKHRHPNTEEKV